MPFWLSTLRDTGISLQVSLLTLTLIANNKQINYRYSLYLLNVALTKENGSPTLEWIKGKVY